MQVGVGKLNTYLHIPIVYLYKIMNRRKYSALIFLCRFLRLINWTKNCWHLGL